MQKFGFRFNASTCIVTIVYVLWVSRIFFECTYYLAVALLRTLVT